MVLESIRRRVIVRIMIRTEVREANSTKDEITITTSKNTASKNSHSTRRVKITTMINTIEREMFSREDTMGNKRETIIGDPNTLSMMDMEETIAMMITGRLKHQDSTMIRGEYLITITTTIRATEGIGMVRDPTEETIMEIEVEITTKETTERVVESTNKETKSNTMIGTEDRTTNSMVVASKMATIKVKIDRVVVNRERTMVDKVTRRISHRKQVSSLRCRRTWTRRLRTSN